MVESLLELPDAIQECLDKDYIAKVESKLKTILQLVKDPLNLKEVVEVNVVRNMKKIGSQLKQTAGDWEQEQWK